eukprot:TCALIF_10769-PA protein Name:"Similar to Trypsin-1 (Astacus astacus)" AED:0.10 eAED:0.10 QI:0/0.8/0.66/0.83/0.6/0.5/6/0/193
MKEELGLSENEDYRIVGGEPIFEGLSFQVSIQEKRRGNHFCGGSIIHQDFVLTAAHCCEGFHADELEIVAGRINIQKAHEEGEQRRDVTEVIIHEDWDSSTVKNDICLLRVGKGFIKTSSVEPIALASENEEFQGTAKVSGWGTTKFGGAASDVLQAVDVPFVSLKGCQESYGEDNIFDTMLCAGATGKDSCQ